MLKYIAKRLLQAIPLLLIISLLVFFLIDLAPYNAVDTLITPNMTAEQIDFLIQKHQLDAPFFARYITWITEVLKGNLGYSITTQTSISSELFARISISMRLIVPAYLTSLILAIVLGLLAAANNGGWADRLIDGVVSITIATPTFWFAMLIIYVFGYLLKWFPILGMHTIGQEHELIDYLKHFIMPYLTLIIAFFPRLTRYIRSSAIQQVKEDYVNVQVAYQAKKSDIFFKHIIKNVMIPIVTQIGMALPMLVTGAIITENIFAWPGIGPYLMSATKALDYPVIMAVLLFSSTLVILGNLLSDILYSIVDPRIRQ